MIRRCVGFDFECEARGDKTRRIARCQYLFCFGKPMVYREKKVLPHRWMCPSKTIGCWPVEPTGCSCRLFPGSRVVGSVQSGKVGIVPSSAGVLEIYLDPSMIKSK